MSDSTFKLTIDSADFKIGRDSERYIHERMEKIDRLTQRFPMRHAQVILQVGERDRMHRFVINLNLPNTTLTAHAEEPHLRGSFDRALKRLLRQLKEYKGMLRREHLHRRAREEKMAARPIDDTEISASARDRNLERFKESIGQHREALEAHIASELMELKRNHPDLDVTTGEVLDRTLAHAIDFFNHKPNHLSRRSWLFRSAMAVMDDIAPRRKIQPTGKLAGEIPLAGWDVLIDEDDEAMATEAASMLTTDELKPVVEEKLSHLPRDWRRAFRMHYVEGLNAVEIGELLDMDDQQVMFRLRGAAEFLRDHMDELRGQA